MSKALFHEIEELKMQLEALKLRVEALEQQRPAKVYDETRRRG